MVLDSGAIHCWVQVLYAKRGWLQRHYWSPLAASSSGPGTVIHVWNVVIGSGHGLQLARAVMPWVHKGAGSQTQKE